MGKLKLYFSCTITFFMAFTSQVVIGQNAQQLKQILDGSNRVELNRLAEESERQYVENYQLALELARINNWPLERKISNGGWLILDGVDELGMPIYVGSDNQNAAISISTNRVRNIGGLPNYNLSGQNYIPRVWDGGAVRRTHQELDGRVSNIDAPTSTSWSEHATHVTGTIMASGVNQSARGMSYQSTGRCFNSANDDSEMATEANRGAFISNHSYGARAGWDFSGGYIWYGGVNDLVDFKNGHYNAKCRQWDLISNNAPFYLICKSAGNSRGIGAPSGSTYNLASGGTSSLFRPANGPYDCLQTYANAKNPLLVGAVNRVVNGYTSPNNVSMSSFSSWGPTDDGRIKPDVVAQGVNVNSSVSSSNTAYGSLSGTSMSTPTASGSGVLLQEYFANTHNGRLMRASTLKGLFIHTADECGQNPGPDYAFGWGLINTRKAAEVIRTDSLTSLILELPIANGGVFEKTFNFTAGTPVTATICWNDPAATVGPSIVDDRTPKLVNDIDVRFIQISSGDTIYPWKLNVAAPTAPATKGDNILDNVEKIDFTPAIGGDFKLLITHKRSLAASQIVSLFVSGIANPSGTACRGTIQYVASQGTFNDGSAATAEYGAMSDCKWIISPLDTNSIIQLSFTRFSLQPGDTLYVRRGKSMSAPVVAKLSGNQIPQNIFVPDGGAFVHFVTDGVLGSTGWEINYSALELPAGSLVTQSTSFCTGIQNRFSFDADGRDTTGYRFNWTFPGGSPSSSAMANPQVTYSQPGSYGVSLSVTNPAGRVELESSNFVTVLPSAPMVVSGFFDGFESDSFPGYPYGGGARWRVSGSLAANNWQLTQDAAFHGASCLMAPNRQTSMGLRSLFSPQFDYTPVQGTLKFSYRYSFARAASNNNDVLQIYTSFDCGRTWTLRRTRNAQGTGVSALATLPGVISMPGNYAPFGESEWALDSLMLNLGAARANVMFRFDMTAGGGHPIYLDNIRFNSDLVTDLFAPSANSIATVYPNPSEGAFTLKLASEGTAVATIIDNLGKIVHEQRLTERVSQFSTSLKPGIYSLRITRGNSTEVKKITVHQ